MAEVREIAGRIWKWVLLGIGVGALYSNATGIIPVAEAMLKGGVRRHEARPDDERRGTNPTRDADFQK